MKRHTKVYIIIINFGKPEHTIECLQSIIDNNYAFFQTIVVDISNIDQSLDNLNAWVEKKKDARFTIIHENENKGFAFANNIGIKYSLKNEDCDYLWILNNDIVIEKESLTELIRFHKNEENNNKLGFVGSKLMDYTNQDIIQNIGGTFNKWTGYSILKGMGEKDSSQYENINIDIDYVVGAAMFCNYSLIKKIGLMPEDYFLYYEDIDWCLSAQKAGYINSTCTNSIVYHKQGISTGAKLLIEDEHLKNKKHLYISYLKLYKRHFKWLLPIPYFILFKQMAGKLYHKNFAEAKLISQVIFNFTPKVKTNKNEKT